MEPWAFWPTFWNIFSTPSFSQYPVRQTPFIIILTYSHSLTSLSGAEYCLLYILFSISAVLLRHLASPLLLESASPNQLVLQSQRESLLSMLLVETYARER